MSRRGRIAGRPFVWQYERGMWAFICYHSSDPALDHVYPPVVHWRYARHLQALRAARLHAAAVHDAGRAMRPVKELTR